MAAPAAAAAPRRAHRNHIPSAPAAAAAAAAMRCSSRQLCTASFLRWSVKTWSETSSVMMTSLLIVLLVL